MNLEILQEQPAFNPYQHQIDAFKQLDSLYITKKKFRGIICIPTGGGKTHTAVIWGLKNFTRKNKKIIWLAHRHELIDQALYSFEGNAYRDYLHPRTQKLKIKQVSSGHSHVREIVGDEDILIISTTTFGNNITDIVAKYKMYDTNEILLVIDEAHHAPARTYRKGIQGCYNSFITSIIGLTATPYRTLESESGAMHKMFNDDIIYKVGLNDLIAKGILSEPDIMDVETNVDLKEAAVEYTQNLHFSDFNLPDVVNERLQRKLDQRNVFIVSTYLKDRIKYAKTVIFTINRVNTIALNELFIQQGVKSSYIISGEQTSIERKLILKTFKEGDTEVLINVNILTEGTDIPNIQTVFLARPTISPILLMQMMGRGLRGPQAQGTKTCFVRSFIDNWGEKIDWASPTELFKEHHSFDTGQANVGNYAKYVIDKEAIKQMSLVADLNLEEFDDIVFINKIPIGFYHFDYAYNFCDEGHNIKKANVLVFCFNDNNYIQFIDNLANETIGILDINSDVNLQHKVESLAISIHGRYFSNNPWVKTEWIKDIIHYYVEKQEKPKFIRFNERSEYDIAPIAKHIIEINMSINEQFQYCEAIYTSRSEKWSAFLGVDSLRKFNSYINKEIQLIWDFKQKNSDPYLQSNIVLMDETDKELDEDYEGKYENIYNLLTLVQKSSFDKYWSLKFHQLSSEMLKKEMLELVKEESSEFGVPKSNGIIKFYIDRDIQVVNYRGVGQGKAEEWNQMRKALIHYLDTVGETSENDLVLEQLFILSTDEKNFIDKYYNVHTSFPLFYLIDKKVQSDLNEREKEHLNNLTEVYILNSKKSKLEIARQFGRTDQGVINIKNQTVSKLLSLIQLLITELEARQLLGQYNLENNYNNSEGCHFTEKFQIYILSKLESFRDEYKLIGDVNHVLFNSRNDANHMWAKLYLCKNEVADILTKTIYHLVEIMATRYKDIYILDLKLNLEQVDLRYRCDILKVMNSEGSNFKFKKLTAAGLQNNYSEVKFVMHENYILEISSNKNKMVEALKDLFYERNELLTNTQVLENFKPGNKFGYPVYDRSNIVTQYKEELKVISVANKWIPVNYLQEFASVERVKNYRKCSFKDLIYEMIVFDNQLNGRPLSFWVTHLNHWLKHNYQDNNLSALGEDKRFDMIKRVDLRNSKGKTPSGYYISNDAIISI